ncbi:coiled-coil domain-containing protein 191 isoform X2 [Hydra vulgaris]|uniref:Coiled-coil domain-containing protein 191 isoform X2 n=1 Tax=Hydra vulgaris TaxID=6087 RepID=A0ABM4B7Q2_HYDVU
METFTNSKFIIQKMEKKTASAVPNDFNKASQNLPHKPNLSPTFVETDLEVSELLESWKKDTSLPASKSMSSFKQESESPTYLSIIHGNCFNEIREEENINLKSNFKHKYFLKDSNEIDEALFINEILNNMRELDISSNVPLDLKKIKVKDHSLRIANRNMEDRAKNKLRQENTLKSKHALLEKQNVAEQAKKRVKEEEEAYFKVKMKEEDDIKKQMIKIKKELDEEKKIRENELQRHQEIFNAAKLDILKEMKIKKDKEILQMQLKKEAEEKRKLELELNKKKFQEESIKKMLYNVKILQCHFSAWHRLVVTRRIGILLLSQSINYKCMLRTWQAWRAYVSWMKFSTNSQNTKDLLSNIQRKSQLAVKHHSQRLVRNCFFSWLSYTRLFLQKKRLLQEHKKNAEKMAIFLEAASNNFFHDKANVGENFDRPNPLHINEFEDKHRNTVLQNIELQNKLALSNKASQASKSLLYSNKELLNSEKKGTEKDIQTQEIIRNSQFLSKELKQSVPNEMQKQKFVKTFRKNNVNHPFYSNRSENYLNKESSTLIKAMEEREKKRKELKERVEAEKRKKEEDRLKELRRQQEERELEEQREKQERLRVKNEEKKLKLQREKEKVLRIEQHRLKNELAINHFNKVLLRKYGLQPLKNIVAVTQRNIETSCKHRSITLLRLVMNKWFSFAKTKVLDRVTMADQFYSKLLLKRGVNSLLKACFYHQRKMDIAANFSCVRIIKYTFKLWQTFVTDERILMWAKESSAIDQNTQRLLKKSFTAWITYVKFQANERQREIGRELLRKKVQLWLPDYFGKTQQEENDLGKKQYEECIRDF